jgi:hypothetical protein
MLLFVLLGLMVVAFPAIPAESPVLLRYQFLSPDTLPDGHPRPLVRDDTIILLTTWEVPDSTQLADSLTVTGDFSRIDPGIPANRTVPAIYEGGRRYRVTYPLSGAVSRRDSIGIRIPLVAALSHGHTGLTEDRRVEVCLSNHPPRHVGSQILRPKDGPYRSGDSLVIETSWHSDDGLPMQVTASFAEIDTFHVVTHGSDRGSGVFVIRYRLPLSKDQMLPDGSNKVIPITAQDAGCGVTTSDSLRIDTDTEPPPVNEIRIDPLPAVTTAESLLVSGVAPQSAIVLFIRNKTQRGDPVPADPTTGRFAGMLELVFGENKIQVRGEDAAGNSSLPYPPSPGGVIVTRVTGEQLDIGAPYSRIDNPADTIDDISLRNPDPMEGVAVRIFNLEGDCLWEERAAATGEIFDFRFHWTGTDRGGERAPQGYYLVRAEWRTPGGKSGSITKGLLLRD